MKRLILAVVLALPVAALATPPEGPGKDPAKKEKREERRRLMRLMGLAEALDLSTADALRMDEAMRRFDERRRPLREQVSESARILERAAEGDSTAQAQVDQAIQRVFDARAQLANIDREMFNELSRGLGPQQRAKMAMFFARFDRKFKGMHRLMKKSRTPRLDMLQKQNPEPG